LSIIQKGETITIRAHETWTVVPIYIFWIKSYNAFTHMHLQECLPSNNFLKRKSCNTFNYLYKDYLSNTSYRRLKSVSSNLSSNVEDNNNQSVTIFA